MDGSTTSPGDPARNPTPRHGDAPADEAGALESRGHQAAPQACDVPVHDTVGAVHPYSTPADVTPVEPHPLCLLLPDMSAEDFASLKADILAHGLLHPILLHEGKILDGRHRARACDELDIVARFEQWSGADPVAFVLSENLHRRHLTTKQRAEIAARLATMSHGGDRKSATIKGSNDPLIPAPAVSIEAAAKMMNVSPASVKRAKAKVASADTEYFPPSARRAPDPGVEDAELVATPTTAAAPKAPPHTSASVYLKSHGTQAAHLAKAAKDLKTAMSYGPREGAPIADALAILADIRNTAEKLSASLAKHADKEVKG